MQSASIEEIKVYLNEIVAQVEAGKEIVITRLGQPIARFSPIKKELKPLPYEKLAEFRARMPKMEISSVDLIRQMREEGY
jgi:antitoxin (DNA-binding transcriptional repressor) of toxin-antitoxin stability system